eukprot:746919-Hanusia_phi.AAC.4
MTCFGFSEAGAAKQPLCLDVCAHVAAGVGSGSSGSQVGAEEAGNPSLRLSSHLQLPQAEAGRRQHGSLGTSLNIYIAL